MPHASQCLILGMMYPKIFSVSSCYPSSCPASLPPSFYITSSLLNRFHQPALHTLFSLLFLYHCIWLFEFSFLPALPFVLEFSFPVALPFVLFATCHCHSVLSFLILLLCMSLFLANSLFSLPSMIPPSPWLLILKVLSLFLAVSILHVRISP